MKREARSERRGRENVTRRRRKKATRESRRKKRRRDEGKKKERKKTRSRQVILQVIQDASCTRYKNSKSFPFSFSLSLPLSPFQLQFLSLSSSLCFPFRVLGLCGRSSRLFHPAVRQGTKELSTNTHTHTHTR